MTGTARLVLAPNPGPMTLEGTNTWVLRAPESQACVVVDPGPLHERHLSDVAGLGPVAVILLTHGHADHSAGARRLAQLTGAPVRALDPAHRLGPAGLAGAATTSGPAVDGLAEGDVVGAAGLELRVLATPGHTGDSLSFVLPDAVLTGDTILGRGTTVVAHPDGVLGPYLHSLERLQDLGERAVLPGHGPELAQVGPAAEHYLRHRRARLEQVRAALDSGLVGADAIVAEVYADVDRALWPAARLSVLAQLAHLGRPEPTLAGQQG